MNQNTNRGSISPSRTLTAYDYMNMPIRLLVQHPDFDPERWARVCAAMAEATRLIDSAIRQGKLEV